MVERLPCVCKALDSGCSIKHKGKKMSCLISNEFLWILGKSFGDKYKKGEGLYLDISVDSVTRTLGDVLFHFFVLFCGQQCGDEALPFQENFSLHCILGNQIWGGATTQGKLIFLSLYSVMSRQPFVKYTVTLLRAGRSICLMFEKQHLFVFVCRQCS